MRVGDCNQMRNCFRPSSLVGRTILSSRGRERESEREETVNGGKEARAKSKN